MATVPRSDANSKTTTWLALVVVLAGLYFARLVLIPFALAILVSFLLAPLVIRLRRWHFGRVPSVLCVVVLAFAILAVIGGLVSIQVSELAHKLPEYQENIQKKIRSIRDSSSGTVSRFTRIINSFSKELTPATPPETAPGEVKPVPVEIHGNEFSPLQTVSGILGSLIGVLLSAGIVIVFVIFMLLQREDLRDRLIRLLGAGRINLTTKALDDAGTRLSRYLLAQLGLNAGYGVLTGVGLSLMGVPNPILWAVLAALFRYVPYLGIWIAASMPAAVALATDPGWWEPVGIFGLYFGIDLVAINFLEPLLYGSSTGISPMAILVAATFWTWMWGPIGLLLATPLTVCLVVVGRYVPSLEFLSILLGDQPVLSPDKRFYQRLLAMDLEEATEIAEGFLKENQSLEKLYDQVMLPALILAEEERHRGRLDDERQRFVVRNARLLVEEIGERADEFLPGTERVSIPNLESLEAGDDTVQISVTSMPARDEADELAALMLAQLLMRRGISTRAISAESLASERIEQSAERRVRLVCVSAVPPFGYLHARYLCKRLRSQLPETKIVAAILNEADPQEMNRREPKIPADEIVTSLAQAVAFVTSLIPRSVESQPQDAIPHDSVTQDQH